MWWENRYLHEIFEFQCIDRGERTELEIDWNDEDGNQYQFCYKFAPFVDFLRLLIFHPSIVESSARPM